MFSVDCVKEELLVRFFPNPKYDFLMRIKDIIESMIETFQFRTIDQHSSWARGRATGRHGLALKIAVFWHTFGCRGPLLVYCYLARYCNGGWTKGSAIGTMGKGLWHSIRFSNIITEGFGHRASATFAHRTRPPTIWHADQYPDIWKRSALELKPSDAKRDTHINLFE